MPQKLPSPELDKVLEITGQIAYAAITSGQLSSEPEAVINYVQKLYPQLLDLHLKS